MSIKEHIEAGHYPVDDKGRALVPVRGGGTAVIYATDFNDDFPIAGKAGGYLYSWHDDGIENHSLRINAKYDLLPPPPRKVKVTRWLVICPRGEWGPYHSEDCARDIMRERNESDLQIVALRGEYEEPWS